MQTNNKLREALGKLRAELWNNTVIAGKRKFELYEIADAALAEPPRNCERFQTKDAAREAFQKLRGHRVMADVSLWDDRDEIEAFLDWLFALGKEGGAK